MVSTELFLQFLSQIHLDFTYLVYQSLIMSVPSPFTSCLKNRAQHQLTRHVLLNLAPDLKSPRFRKELQLECAAGSEHLTSLD